MSSVYVLLIDPSAPTATAAPVDAAKLWHTTPAANASKPSKTGTTHLFFGNNITAVSSFGDKFAQKRGDERREVIRKTVGSAIKKVRELGDSVEGSKVFVDASADPHAAAVAAHLALYSFTLKTNTPSKFDPRLTEPIPDKLTLAPLAENGEWETGVIYAQAQNLARTLMELPANIMTPTAFTERVKAEAAGIPNLDVIVRDTEWAAQKGMRTFLSVAKGSQEPAKFLEIHYKGGAKDAAPLVLVGKGITFDSGGISLKPAADMKLMRGDMGGAATVSATVLALAKLKVPINVVVLTPLTENLPGPTANKPGDTVYAMNGKSIEIDNTDAEGRLVLSDAIYYGSTEFKPHTLIDVATLTGSMDYALGEVYSGVFTNSDSLWNELHTAGLREHDRFWRMPLDEEYGPQIYSSNADLCNTGGKRAGCCTAALFLKSFVEGVEPADGADEPALRWAHIDIAGSMEASSSGPYHEKIMTGRPTRALIEFVRGLAQQ
ncbi:leucine aminopeptidase [Dichomitus squalens LYAD-421 SS1]|uniref:Leucine aminopeptidase n=1 Tax=Dichomitus squalens (strain LYAD-421) TaxID=732165 RepID=R7SJU5_DICSQ|nr:leucine aminopeptidase [Dichomitus squalens LYAD-421 SS1]EJF56123.1 leucine aminopeptidase [Dichomitus squalens LYAD-421 SS1]